MNKDGDRKACIFFYAGGYRTGLFGWTVESMPEMLEIRS